jgi:uncharacterized protein
LNKDRFLADNTELNRYEMSVEGKTAFVDYIINKTGTIYLTHTEVPRELEGKGLASVMLKMIMEEIEKRELSLIPICPFVKTYLSRHPDWKKLLDEHHKF